MVMVDHPVVLPCALLSPLPAAIVSLSSPPLQFNVALWLDSYDPNLAERSQMLDFISQGLTLCGPTPSPEGDMLVEVGTTLFSKVED